MNVNFKEVVESLKGKLQAKITAESSAEYIQEINDLVAEVDSLETTYNELVSEHSKAKDTIVRMVMTQGDGKKPVDDSNGSKTMSIEEAIAEVQKEGGQ